MLWTITHKGLVQYFDVTLVIFTLHAQCEWGKVIGVGVHIYLGQHDLLLTTIYLKVTFINGNKI